MDGLEGVDDACVRVLPFHLEGKSDSDHVKGVGTDNGCHACGERETSTTKFYTAEISTYSVQSSGIVCAANVSEKVGQAHECCVLCTIQCSPVLAHWVRHEL